MKKSKPTQLPTMPRAVLSKLEKIIANKIGTNRNLARELADVLQLSQESIYRRFRGETMFTLNEAWIIQKEYGVSIDELFDNNGKIGVDFSPFHEKEFVVEAYLSDVCQQLMKFSKEKACRVFSLAADIPLFRFFGYPSLTQFKLFYWKNLTNQDKSNHEESFKYLPGQEYPLCDEIESLYKAVQVDEIWSKDTLNGTLNQIEYYFESGLIPQRSDLVILYKDLMRLINDLVYDEKKGKLTFHQYELAFNNNSFFVSTSNHQFLAIGINGINSLQTKDDRVIDDYKKWLDNVLSKSLKISGQSQKQKFSLYNSLRTRILQSAGKLLTDTDLESLQES